MKKVVSSLILGLAIYSINAQTAVAISQGEGYMNDVYVSMEKW